jgi:hypothetical protein
MRPASFTSARALPSLNLTRLRAAHNSRLRLELLGRAWRFEAVRILHCMPSYPPFILRGILQPQSRIGGWARRFAFSRNWDQTQDAETNSNTKTSAPPGAWVLSPNTLSGGLVGNRVGAFELRSRPRFSACISSPSRIPKLPRISRPRSLETGSPAGQRERDGDASTKVQAGKGRSTRNAAGREHDDGRSDAPQR